MALMGRWAAVLEMEGTLGTGVLWYRILLTLGTRVAMKTIDKCVPTPSCWISSTGTSKRNRYGRIRRHPFGQFAAVVVDRSWAYLSAARPCAAPLCRAPVPRPCAAPLCRARVPLALYFFNPCTALPAARLPLPVVFAWCDGGQSRALAKIQLMTRQNADMASRLVQIRSRGSDDIDADALIANTAVERQCVASPLRAHCHTMGETDAACVCGVTRLMQLSAQEKAISDTMYYLAKGLESNRIEVQPYIKVRFNKVVGGGRKWSELAGDSVDGANMESAVKCFLSMSGRSEPRMGV